MSRAQYLADPNFLSIDAKLRRDSNLAGFDVVSVSRQLVNGYNYAITYRNQQGVTIVYNVYVTFKGDITVNGATTQQTSQQGNQQTGQQGNQQTGQQGNQDTSSTTTTISSSSTTTGGF